MSEQRITYMVRRKDENGKLTHMYGGYPMIFSSFGLAIAFCIQAEIHVDMLFSIGVRIGDADPIVKHGVWIPSDDCFLGGPFAGDAGMEIRHS